jgi:prolyl-tRNA editing enzyme YbaK/EbsC (Cys-tRNA(Pro) deacylase)
MTSDLSDSAQRVQRALAALGFELDVVELPSSTRTAQEAAQAVGVRVGQIAKSLVFQVKRSGEALLVIASGANRVDEMVLGKLVGEEVSIAHPDYVRERTGFAVGGVPPVGHQVPLRTWIDQDLLQYDEIWAAAGNPHAVFRLDPGELGRMTGGSVAQIC